MNTIHLSGTTTSYECTPDDTLLRAGLRAGLALSYAIYFAGPPPMTQAVQRTLIQHKVPLAQMHFDPFF